MKIRYSVIIPVYNAEKTIRRCLDSLLPKHRRDVEIILVDDGSTDMSGQICKEYAVQHEYIKYVYQDNGGVSSARNRGICLSLGEFILFADSDDYVSVDYYSTIDQAVEEYSYDLIIFSNIKKKGFKKTRRRYGNFEARDRAALMPRIIDSICRKYINYPWGKVYKAKVIKENSIYFPLEVSLTEDRAFNIKYSLYINSLRILSDPLYYVCLDNDNSLSRKHIEDLEHQFSIADQYLTNAISVAPLNDADKGRYREALNFGECRGVYRDAKIMHRNHLSWFERINKIGKICDNVNNKKMKYPDNRFCKLVTLPVRWRLTLFIDAMAWKLVH